MQVVERGMLDLSDSMRKVIRTNSPKASRVIDCFHINKREFDIRESIII